MFLFRLSFLSHGKIFAKEIQTSERSELQEDYITQELIKAGGANYGTGMQNE